MTPSPFQQALYDEFATGASNLFVDAGPGSGKTTTLIEAAKYIPKGKSVAFFCFNKHIAQELQRRLPSSATAFTIHAHGRQSLLAYSQSKGRRLMEPDKWKYVNIAEQALEAFPMEYKIKMKMKFELKNLVLLALNTRTEYGQGAPTETIEMMALKYNISVSDTLLYSLVAPCVKAGIDMWKMAGSYDFIDMTTLPVILDMSINKYDEVLIDEGQDLNDAQLTLMFRSVTEKGRISLVADRLQSIMGFAGAMPDAVDQFVARAHAKAMPLSVCYRCPPNHVAIVQHVSPNLKPFKTEPGIIQFITSQESFSMLQKGDFVICRLCAPLVKHCLALVSKGISALIKGEDIGKELIRFAESAQDHRELLDHQWTGFPNALTAESQRLLVKMTAEKREMSMEFLQDKVNALIALYDHFSVTDFKEYCDRIKRLFVDQTYSATIVLCTIHKSKGLEANRIFIIDGDEKRDFWPLARKGALDWELEQERNIIYVGVTRAKQALYFINVKDKHEARLSYFVDGRYARLGSSYGKKTREQTKKTTVPKPSEPVVIDTKVILEKKEERMAKYKAKKEHQLEEAEKPFKQRAWQQLSPLDDD